jgi:hypothetical protein
VKRHSVKFQSINCLSLKDGLQQRQGGEGERLHVGHPTTSRGTKAAKEVFQLFLVSRLPFPIAYIVTAK